MNRYSGGSITRTNTGFAMQINITRSTDKMTVASYSGTFTLDELTGLTGVRRASLDLLQKMDITLTERARTELSGAAGANHVSAQTALARGITIQHLGNTTETLVQYYQAAAFDPTLTEAAARTNTMAASVRTGSLGADIRNDIAWRDEWVTIHDEARTSLQNMPHPHGVNETWLKHGTGTMFFSTPSEKLQRLTSLFNDLPPVFQNYVMVQMEQLLAIVEKDYQ